MCPGFILCRLMHGGHTCRPDSQLLIPGAGFVSLCTIYKHTTVGFEPTLGDQALSARPGATRCSVFIYGRSTGARTQDHYFLFLPLHVSVVLWQLGHIASKLVLTSLELFPSL